MFEYWLLGARESELDRTGTTHDFLEVCAQITRATNSIVCGQFVRELMEAKKRDLEFLRVVDWKFETEITHSVTEDLGYRVKIILHKHI